MTGSRMQRPLARFMPIALVYAGLAACGVGLLLHRLWLDVPGARLAEQIVMATVAAALAWPLQRHGRMSWATALAWVWLAALAWFAGLPALLATAWLAAAAVALGSLLVPRASAPVLALAAGLALIGGGVGWLLTWPVHHAWLYWPALLVLCALRRHALLEWARRAAEGWRTAVAASPRGAAFALMLLGVTSRGAWLPTLLSDDVNYHALEDEVRAQRDLLLETGCMVELGRTSAAIAHEIRSPLAVLYTDLQLLRHARYLPDLANQIWAAAPWLGDALQGIAAVLAQGEARGPLVLLWLLIAAAATWSLVRALASARMAWLALALVVSLPFSSGLLGSMQTELPALGVLAALALAIMQPRPAALLIAVLAGALVALKFSHLVAALVMLAWAGWRRGRAGARELGAAGVAFVFVAGSSYLQAALLSGNPMFPLFNQWFQSPLLEPRQLDDLRWHAGRSLDLPWRITFLTHQYFEGWRGAFGFALVALGGAWLLALRAPRTRGIAWAATAVMLLPLLPMQYARYAYPGLALLLVPLVVTCATTLGERRAAYVLAALCLLDAAFLANANWTQHTHALRLLVVTRGNIAQVYEHYAPERALIARLRARDDGESIVLALDPAAPAIAELAGRGRSVAWYAPGLERARVEADADPSGQRWVELVRRLDARWLLLREAALTAAQRAALQRLAAHHEASADVAQLWSVPPAAAQ